MEVKAQITIVGVSQRVNKDTGVISQNFTTLSKNTSEGSLGFKSEDFYVADQLVNLKDFKLGKYECEFTHVSWNGKAGKQQAMRLTSIGDFISEINL